MQVSTESTSAGPTAKNLIAGVHGLRGVAALAIVFFHAGGILALDRYQGAGAAARLTVGLEDGVDLFFVISGFVISLPVFLGRRAPVGQYLLHRLLRIYPLAMLTALLFLVSNWVVFGRPPELASVVSSVFLVPSQTDPTPVVLWTLKQKLLFYAVFALSFHHRTAGLALVTAWCLASLVVPQTGVLTEWLFHSQNLQFLFGIVAGWAFVNRPAPQRVGAVLAVAGIAAFGAVAYGISKSGAPPPASEVLPLGVTGLIVVYGAASARATLPAAFLFIGTASYSIYLIHYFFLSLGNKLLFTAMPDLAWPLALLVLVSFATAAGALYYLLAEERFERLRHSLRRRASAG